MLNRVELIGHLGQDPDIRKTTAGNAVANVSLATSERWTDKDGQKQEKTEWHRVVVFGKLAEVAERYLRKGARVYFCGKLQTRKWQDQSGQDRYTTEIVVNGFDGKLIMLDRAQGGSRSSDPDGDYGYRESGGSAPPPNDLDDSIPF